MRHTWAQRCAVGPAMRRRCGADEVGGAALRLDTRPSNARSMAGVTSRASRREANGPGMKGPAMLANSYSGIVEKEVSRLVVSRARRLRVSGDEIDDLQQQIVPKLAAFEYDAAKSNGASRSTALTGVIDRQIKAHL